MRRPVLLIFGCLLLACGLFVASGSAGDGSILVYPDEEEYEVAPGDEVEIAIYVSHHGTLHGLGLENISVVGEYDDSILQVSDIEAESWFQNDSGELSTTSETDDPGIFRFSEELEDSDNGVISTDRFITVTFTVNEDAEATNTTVDLSQSRVRIAGGIPSPVFATNAELRIDNGEDPLSGFGVGAAMVVLAGIAFFLRHR